MPTERAKSLFDQFLATAVAEHKFGYASISIHDPTGQMQSRYEQLTSLTLKRDRRSDMLTEEQCEKCIAEFIKDQNAGGPLPYLIHQTFDITRWRIRGEPSAATVSHLSINYSRRPTLTTLLMFETIEQFQYIRSVLGKLGLCKLNDRHLKPLKIKCDDPRFAG